MKIFTTDKLFTALVGVGALLGTAGAYSQSFRVSPQGKESESYSYLGSRIQKSELGRVNPGYPSASTSKSPKNAFQKQDTSSGIVIVEEDFSKWTEGDDSNPVYLGDIEGFYQNEDRYDVSTSRMSDGLVWSGVGLSSAGGACGLCFPDYGGFLNTPGGIDYSGFVTTTVKVKAVAGKNNQDPSLIISFIKDKDSNFPTLVDPAKICYTEISIPDDGEWHEVEWAFENSYGGTDAAVQFNTYEYLLIDDIKIVKDLTLLSSPVLLPATDFTYDGFTANWKDVGNATDYLLTSWTNKQLTDEHTLFNEQFEGINHKDGVIDENEPNLPEEWTIDFNDGDKRIFVSDDKRHNALCFCADGQSITTPYTVSPVLSASLDIRFAGTPDTNIDEETGEEFVLGFPGKLSLEGWDGYKWFGIVTIMSSELVHGNFYNLDLTEYLPANIYLLRLKVSDLSEYDDAYIAIDNFKLEMAPKAERIYALQDEPVSDTHYVLTGLDPKCDYFYSVRARNTELGIDSGEPENDMFAFGIPVITVLEPTEVNKDGSYTANWEPTPKAQEYEVGNYRVFTAPKDIEGQVVLEEWFNKNTSEATIDNYEEFHNVSLMKLDDYCDNLGWVGYLCGVADGAIGGIGIQMFGMRGEIQTPYLSLGNNNGRFKVQVSAMGLQPDNLYVTNSSGIGGVVPLEEDFDVFTAELDGGVDFDFLSFSTENATPFFINYICVTQDIKAGDKVKNLNHEVKTTDNKYHFDGLKIDNDHSYGYVVYGIHKYINNQAWSKRSEVKYVDFKTTYIDEIDTRNIKVSALKGKIKIEAEDGVETAVYMLNGAKIASTEGSAEIPCVEGIYIVKSDGAVCKVVVK